MAACRTHFRRQILLSSVTVTSGCHVTVWKNAPAMSLFQCSWTEVCSIDKALILSCIAARPTLWCQPTALQHTTWLCPLILRSFQFNALQSSLKWNKVDKETKIIADWFFLILNICWIALASVYSSCGASQALFSCQPLWLPTEACRPQPAARNLLTAAKSSQLQLEGLYLQQEVDVVYLKSAIRVWLAIQLQKN